MPDISEVGLVPEEGERSITFGGTRAGKSALDEWRLRQIMHERPNCMAALVDSKPRFRAETERGHFRRGRKSAAYRYESWAKGPVVPNSVVVDIYDEKPFKDIWNRPGEVAILQGGTLKDWKQILRLLNGFVEANIKGRERLIQVDECLDFTVVTLSELILRTMCSTARREQAANGISVSTSVRIVSTACLPSFSIWLHESHCFICDPTTTCDISERLGSKMPNHQTVNTYSGNGPLSPAVRFRHHSRDVSHSLMRT
jgi:hypothetical protein